jgi:hypothetical protein
MDTSAVSGVAAMSALDIALEYAARGIPVFPCCRAKKVPLVQGGFKAASADPAQISEWWARYPGAMIGMATGAPSGLVVLDVDVKNGHDGPATLAKLVSKHGNLPETWIVSTPSGGQHYIFAHDPARPLRCSAGKLGDGLDVRSDHGYIIAAGSVDGHGRAYKTTCQKPPAAFPDWMRGAADAPVIAHRPVSLLDYRPRTGGNSYGAAALDGETEKVANAPAGTRNAALNTAAFRLGQLVATGELDAQSVTDALLSAASLAGLVAEDGERQTLASIASGLKAGKASPRTGQRPAMAANDRSWFVVDGVDLSVGVTGEYDPFAAPSREAPEQVSGPPPVPANDARKLPRATPFALKGAHLAPKRQWLYGRFLIRKTVSLTIAPGGTGKSILSIVEALALATGRRLLHDWVHERCKVWLYNLEDDRDELTRRVEGAAKCHGITHEQIDGHLFVDSGLDTPCIMARQEKSGTMIAAPVVDAVVSQIRELGIDVLVIDPFVSCHQVNENDNGAIDAVVKQWASIANATGCAVHLVHHSRKNGDRRVEVEDGRGAVALLAAVRSARVLNTMTEEEAEKAGIDDSRHSYVRIETGKANLAPLTSREHWFKLENVDLENGGPGNLDMGDGVGVPVVWQWPQRQATHDGDRDRIMEALATGGPWRDSDQATSQPWAGIAVLEALELDADNKAHRKRAKLVLSELIKAGVLVKVDGQDPARKPVKFIQVACSTTPETPVEQGGAPEREGVQNCSTTTPLSIEGGGGGGAKAEMAGVEQSAARAVCP